MGMRPGRWLGCLVLFLPTITGCAYTTAIQQLSPGERAAFRACSKVMTPRQARVYLAKATPAERAAYLADIGITQRFLALAPQDRQAIFTAYPRKGMSAEALHFLWGTPYYTAGYTGHYEHWFYLGSSFSLAAYGSVHSQAGTMVDVYLVNGRVVWWLEFVPSIENGADDASSRSKS